MTLDNTEYSLGFHSDDVDDDKGCVCLFVSFFLYEKIKKNSSCSPHYHRKTLFAPLIPPILSYHSVALSLFFTTTTTATTLLYYYEYSLNRLKKTKEPE